VPKRPESLTDLEAEARDVLGDQASEWIVRPSRLLDGMTPAEVATTPAGARVVIHELRRAAVPVKAAMKKRRLQVAR
jgi:uncharacterized protein (DUF2384 family)